MILSRRTLLVAAALVAGALFIESRNHVRIAPAPGVPPSTSFDCPTNESVPFSPECMAFINGRLADLPRPMNADVSAESPELP